jgi:hypothetical protein
MRALSIAPLVYVVGALVYLAAGGPSGWPLVVVHGLMMIASLMLIVGSIVHVRRNESLGNDEKITWVLLAVFVAFIALPVYWFVIARRPPRGETPRARAAAG